jgi:hypothetical protein
MKIKINQNDIIIIREKSDKKIYKESTFFYKVKNELVKMGYDVIRKNPAKETHFAHLTDMPFYIRGRKINDNTPLIYDDTYQIRFIYEDFNKIGQCSLFIMGNLDYAKF